MRKFEKINYEQFTKDISDNKDMYNEYNIPKRGTKFSAGYDFYLIDDIILNPGETKKIPTGIKVDMNDSEVLLIIIRSSLGFKYNIRLTNQVGVIDKDYYNNISNEGHMWISIQNEGQDVVSLKKNTAVVQGIFINYLITDGDNVENVRTNGIGSTTKEE